MSTLKTTTHVDKVLTNISVAYAQESSNFVADKVFPKIPVKQRTGIFFKYKKGDMFRDEMKVRAKGSESAGSDMAIGIEEPYVCQRRALHVDLTEEEILNYDTPLAAKTDNTEWLMEKSLLNREVDWAERYFKKGVWTTELQGVADAGAITDATKQFVKWSNALSNPIEDVTNAMLKQASNTAFRPNKFVCSPKVFYCLKNHETIIDRIKYTQKGIVTPDLIATLFEVDNVYVAWGVVNSSAKGEEDVVDFIMGDHALLCYVPASPGLKKPSAGYIFTWTGLMGAGAYGNRIYELPMDITGLGNIRLEIEMAYQTRRVCQDLATFFIDCV